MTPIVIVSGPAGSGKDTVAQMIVDKVGGQCIAQADPMKQFARAAFGFTDLQLWGPSDERNKEDQRFLPIETADWKAAEEACQSQVAATWLRSIGFSNAAPLLQSWFKDLKADFLTNQRVLTPRAVLQTLGTEFGRQITPEVWSQVALNNALQLLKGGCHYDKTVGVIKNNANYGLPLVIITDGRFRNEVVNVSSIGGRALKIAVPERRKEADDVEKAGIANHRSEAEQTGIPNFWYNYIHINDKSLGLDQLRYDVEFRIIPTLLNVAPKE